MENQMISQRLKEKNSIVKRLVSEFEKEDCNNVTLSRLDRAIEEQAKLQGFVFEEDSEHYKLCLQKILFLEEMGEHKMAEEYSQEIVEEYPDYSDIFYDVFDHYSDIGKHEIAASYGKLYTKPEKEE
jgi:uncharacterized protein YlxP (DUF503 family)